MVEPLFAFVDTNILLEFQPLEQINWCTILSATHVVLVIAHEVIGELQGGKDGETSTKRKRQRAAARLKYIERRLGTGPGADGAPPRDRLRDGVEWTFDPPPNAAIYTTHDLDRGLADDRLAAALLSAQARGWNVCLVTNDAGSRMRLRLLGIRAENLSEDLRLPSEPDPTEEELRRVTRELTELKSRLPRLSLAFEDATSQVRVALPTPIDNDSNTVGRFELGLERICPEYAEARSPLHRIADTDPTLSFNIGWYESGRVRFLGEMRPLIPRLIAHHNHIDLHTRVVGLVLSNVGSAPAEHVEVVMALPAGILAAERLPNGPERPTAPSWPSSKKRADRAFGSIMADHLALRIREPTMPRLVIRTARGRTEVAVQVNLLRHAQSANLPEFYVVFPTFDDARSFTIEYAIHTNNPVPAVEGMLNVILQKLPDARPFTEMGARRMADEDEPTEE